MPAVNEEEQNRQTYGTPNPGWITKEVSVAAGQPTPMKGPRAQAASPTADADAASSAEVVAAPPQEQVSETAPPPSSQPVPEVKPWNMPPEERWDELRREREEWKRRYHELAIKPSAPPPPPPQQADPWEALVNHPDPATAQFYQQQRRLVEHAVAQGRDQAMREVQPLLDNLQRRQVAIDVKDFRRENPDIQPGSDEEALVIAYMEGRVDGVRHPIESARNNAVIKRLESEVKVLKERQAGIPQKRQAAQVERGTGIPQTAGLPPRPAGWQERAGAIIDKGGGMVDVAKAIFGGGRKPVVSEE